MARTYHYHQTAAKPRYAAPGTPGTGYSATVPVSAGSFDRNSFGHNGGSSKQKRSKRSIIIAVAAVVLVLAAIYGGGVLFFTSHFFPNTTLNDEDLSFQSGDTLAAELQQQVDSYTLDLKGQGFEYSFDHDALTLDIDPQKIVSDALAAQNIAAWPVEAFGKHDASDVVVASYDEGGFADVLKEQVASFNESQDSSVDATIAYDEASDALVIKPETYGTQLDADKLIKAVGSCMSTMRTSYDITSDDLQKPTVLAADPRTTEALQQANTLFPNNVDLMLNGSVKAATIDKATFAGWLSIDPESFSPVINQDAVTQWVDEKTAGMNTVGTERTYTRADGKTITVSGGTYGWQVDTASLAQTVYDALSQGEATTVDIPTSQAGDVYNGAGKRDWGAYVDVDLSDQTARYYDANDNLVHSCGVVSGLPTKDRATPTGVYYLRMKQSPSVLTGYKNGKIDYETPVQYWMPFIGNSVGLHDATWQASFGGTRYKTNGSHGCINLSTADAKWFYDNLQKGVCVITHN